MTKTLEAGSELDAEVAELVEPMPIGHQLHGPVVSNNGWWAWNWNRERWVVNKHPSTDRSAAGEVLQSELLQEHFDEFAVVLMAELNVPRDRQGYQAVSDVLSRLTPLAICLAALAALAAVRKGKCDAIS